VTGGGDTAAIQPVAFLYATSLPILAYTTDGMRGVNPLLIRSALSLGAHAHPPRAVVLGGYGRRKCRRRRRARASTSIKIAGHSTWPPTCVSPRLVTRRWTGRLRPRWTWDADRSAPRPTPQPPPKTSFTLSKKLLFRELYLCMSPTASLW